MGIRRWFSGTLRPDKLETDSVSTEQARITNETKIVALRRNNPGATSSGTWVNLVDSEEKDTRNELNTNFQFTPTESGYYEITARAVFVSISDQDNIQVRIYNTTQASIPDGGRTLAQSSGSLDSIQETFEVELIAGDTYEVQATDNSSSFNINGNRENGCKMAIERSVIV